MTDAREVPQGVLAGSETVVGRSGTTHHHTGGGAPVPLRLRRRASDAAWVFEVGTPAATVPVLAGVAREQDVRAFARGVLDTLEARAGEHGFRLFDDGRTQVPATVGYGPEPYLTLEASFGPGRDRVAAGPDGGPPRSAPFGWSYAELDGIPLAEPAALAGFARALLEAVGE
ncbi:hypothetical protein ACIRBY_26585 [Streptomyces sp. NPDC096136]|uniref:hypothetical protein n=1 Tax=Streptomyces sp. NPDC096136 TaxID=3366076 RepID=UPI00380CB3F7